MAGPYLGFRECLHLSNTASGQLPLHDQHLNKARMNIHARISKEWRQRMIFMAIMLNGCALWFCYDGFWAWPAEATRYAQLQVITVELVPADKELDPKDPAVIRAWETYAATQNLKPKVPKKRTLANIAGQQNIGGVMLIIGLGFIGWVALQHRRSVRAEADLITGPSGEQVHLDSIIDMDRRKWANKGIAYAIYEVNGRRRRLCLDDHKFIGCEAIILEAERRIAVRAAAAPSAAPEANA